MAMSCVMPKPVKTGLAFKAKPSFFAPLLLVIVLVLPMGALFISDMMSYTFFKQLCQDVLELGKHARLAGNEFTPPKKIAPPKKPMMCVPDVPVGQLFK